MGLSDHKVQSVLAVSDLDQARRFYGEQLGLGAGEEVTGGVAYACAEGTSIFVYHSPDNAGRSTATLAGWDVGDLDATIADLASRGVNFEQYDQPGIKTDERGVFAGPGFRAAWVTDPDGNVLAITQIG